MPILTYFLTCAVEVFTDAFSVEWLRQVIRGVLCAFNLDHLDVSLADFFLKPELVGLDVPDLACSTTRCDSYRSTRVRLDENWMFVKPVNSEVVEHILDTDRLARTFDHCIVLSFA